MVTITEDYCSFEVAKLLKEKGFDAECRAAYTNYGKLFTTQIQQYITNALCSRGYLWDCIAPTLQMTMKWLREEHNIVCNIDIESRNFYYYSIFIIRSSIEAQYQLTSQKPYFKTYEEACEAAIKYCLENLI